MTRRFLMVLCLMLTTGWVASTVEAARPPVSTHLDDITSIEHLRAAASTLTSADAGDFTPVERRVTATPPDDWQPDPARDLQNIHGADDRIRLSPALTPYTYILSAWEDFTYASSCSGAFIGPKVVLTAAHCIYDQELGIWADASIIIPGKDSTIEPLGYVFSTLYYVPAGFINSTGNSLDSIAFDFAIIVLDTPLGNTAGTLTPAVLSNQELMASDLAPFTIGYPGDKPEGTQWKTTEGALTEVDPTFIYSRLDVIPGQSGSPVMRGSDGVIFGVVSSTLTFWNNSNIEIARRINTDTITFIQQSCAATGCTINTYTPPATPTPEPPEEPEEPAGPTDPEPTVPPTPEPEPEEPPTTPSLPRPQPAGEPHPAFETTWARPDLPVADGDVSRTWIWGPEPFTGAVYEPYAEAPGGQRMVIYYDKSRMEITNPSGDANSPWFVTNGLLVKELITGLLQVGDHTFEEYAPAEINVAGDSDDPTGPTYATFASVLDTAPLPTGTVITQTIDRDGNIGTNPSHASHNVTAARYVPETDHTVASVFWDFMNSEGPVFTGDLTTAPLFPNPFYATGLPITEPYWATVKVAGTYQTVLIQVFERRVLTYTPTNPAGWTVEAGNVGQHYYLWRYGQLPN